MAKVDSGYYRSFNEALEKWNGSGKTLTLLADVTTKTTIEIRNIDVPLILDLNGYGIIYKDDNNFSSVIKVCQGANLTLQDNGESKNHYIELKDWKGISVTGTGSESGIDDTGKGFIKVTGGYITGGGSQTTGGGVHVDPRGTFAMTGGNIIGNTASKGGGVYVETGGTFILSGNPTIKYNSAYSKTNNVYLSNNSQITLTAKLTNTDPIGVNMESPGVFTNSTTTDYNEPSKFTSDNTDYAVGKNTDGQLLLGDTVTLTYDANGATSGDAPTDNSSPYASGSSVTVLPKGKLDKTGYDFDGWKIGDNETIYAASTDGIPKSSPSFTITGNTTLKAQWKAIPAIAPTVHTEVSDKKLVYGYNEDSLSFSVTPDSHYSGYDLSYQWL